MKLPTKKQLNFLEALGYDGEYPETRKEASLLISSILRENESPTDLDDFDNI